jgi:ribosomal protein S18 acetylase RimI-like enzyme
MPDSSETLGTWHRQQYDSAGENVGYIKGRICHDEADLDSCIGFSKPAGGFAPYAEQISPAVVWPIAALLDLEIYKALRRRGLGSTALDQFFAYARAEGAGIAFLRVGWWSCGDPYAARDRNISWYSRRGFRGLKPAAPQILTPYMYRFL